jgi:hypothetical protein
MICFLALSLLHSLASLPDHDGQIPYRTLTWTDFPVVSERPKPDEWAMTWGYVEDDYHYRWTSTGGKFRISLTDLTVRSGLDVKKSWRWQAMPQADLDRLLPHEQGHLDINEIVALKLRKLKLSDWPQGEGKTSAAAISDLEDKIANVVKEAGATGLTEQELYDRETRHGVRLEAQKRWAARIRLEMSENGG